MAKPKRGASQLQKFHKVGECILVPKRWAKNARASNAQQRILILIPGMGTEGEWLTRISQEEAFGANIEIHSISFDSRVYWLELLLRSNFNSTVEFVTSQIQTILSGLRSNVQVSFACHSFASIIACKTITKLDRKFHAMFFLGAICRIQDVLPLTSKFQIVVNDCGFRDYWPIAAGVLRWCRYYPAGHYGLKVGGIQNRYFNYRHNDYVTTEHFRTFIFSYLRDGKLWAPVYKANLFPHNLFAALKFISGVIWGGILAGLFIVGLALVYHAFK